MPKSNIDRDAYEHIVRVYEHAKGEEWPRRWDSSWASDVALCSCCSARFDLSRPGTPAHKPGCALAESLAFMETWLRVEGDLLTEQDDAEEKGAA